MNWHEPTQDDIDGKGDYRFIVDIQPDFIPHQAGTDGDSLIRISRPGWSWLVREFIPEKKRDTPRLTVMDSGESETRPAAIADAQAALARLRA